MPAFQPDQPTAFVNSPSSATIVPSVRAPARSRWIVALRLPAAVCSSRRVSAQRTGRPVRFASSAATNVYSSGPFFEPKPPPMNSQTTRTLSRGSLERLGDRVAHAPDELRRDVDVEHVARPLADRLVRLHRVVEDGLRAVRRLDDDVGLRERLLDVAALVVARLGA